MKPGDVFVFGSNRLGIHGAGAAYLANKYYGAVWGCGEGHRAASYALPTKATPRERLSLNQIREHVETFLDYARTCSERKFRVTRVGCGLAGYKDAEIAPLFCEAPKNCCFDSLWKPYLGEDREYFFLEEK